MSGFLKIAIASSVLAVAFALELQFDGARFPDSEYDKHNGYASQMARIDGKDREVIFENIIRSGMTYNGVTFGAIVDNKGGPLKEIFCNSTIKAASAKCVTLPSQEQSNSLDYSSFIPIAGTDKYRVISHFEASIGQMSMFEITFDKTACTLTNVQKLSNIDWSESHGLWNPCAGSLSPWGTHLGSEEYEPDARLMSSAANFYDKASMKMVNNTLETLNTAGQLYSTLEYIRYFNVYPEMVKSIVDILKVYRPYRYGYANEVTSIDSVTSNAQKLWAIGRKAFEMLLVMPDRKTAYGTDDGASGLLTKFICTRENDLTEGILYVSKVTQKAMNLATDPFQAGEFTIEWINMGSATAAEIRTAADTLDFSDIFEVEQPLSVAPFCSTGFTSVNTITQECLKLKPGMEKIASRLEMRRYAAMMGATVEWNKMEGISLDIANKRLYLGISSVDKGMTGLGKYDKGGNAQIAVPANPCGCVYSIEMDADYSATSMKGAICGKPSKLDPMNKCDVNSISNPDNIWYDNKYNSLFIAEDTSNHQNDVMWQFDPITGSLTRTLSSPYGSEITSTEFHHFGECDIMEVVFQHPYGESDQKMLLEKGNSGDGAYLSYMRMPVKQQLVTPSTTTAPSSATTLAPASSSALKVATSSSLLAAFLVVSGMLML